MNIFGNSYLMESFILIINAFIFVRKIKEGKIIKVEIFESEANSLNQRRNIAGQGF